MRPLLLLFRLLFSGHSPEPQPAYSRTGRIAPLIPLCISPTRAAAAYPNSSAPAPFTDRPRAGRLPDFLPIIRWGAPTSSVGKFIVEMDEGGWMHTYHATVYEAPNGQRIQFRTSGARAVPLSLSLSKRTAHSRVRM